MTVQCDDKAFRRWHLTSPEGCVLPVLEVVKEHLGEVRFMLPAIRNRLLAKKIVVMREHGASGWLVDGPQDVEKLECGLVRWKMEDHNMHYGNPLVRYVSMSSLPATATEYLDMLKLHRPHPFVPDPFGAEFWAQVSATAMLKIPRPKIDEKAISPEAFKDLKIQYERANQLLTMMPPASFDGAWYAVVRVHFKEDAEVTTKSKVKIGLICIEQLIDADDDAVVYCWAYHGVEFRAGGEMEQMIALLEQRIADRARNAGGEF